MASNRQILEKLTNLEQGQAKIQRSQANLENGQAELKRSLGKIEALLTPHCQEKKDGPIPSDTLRVKDKEYSGFSADQWKLLEILWGKDAVPIEDVKDHVYGHDHKKSDNALAGVKKRLNRKLLDKNCRAVVEAVSGYYRLTVY